ncbi:hypothetical protein HUW51_04450 [Adhaeribacter swui]|uniref:Uncharacterized protein n=1 Tax=Adhaeribacter swui TaxID=2086471 RepID=A0A7G7G4C8_9BACT|nr:hypothetical protein [Adhaeribacter swui]QNF32012.1 hypothetical protein HUW51_04450 [Adhaeribacter swui]
MAKLVSLLVDTAFIIVTDMSPQQIEIFKILICFLAGFATAFLSCT